MQDGQVITRGKVLKYLLLPGIIPRLRYLASNSPMNIAYLIVCVFNAVRILPGTHPFLRQDKIGTYSIKRAIAEAADHIVVSRNNIDQIIIFFSILVGIILLSLQFIALFAALIIQPAQALGVGGGYSMFFQTPSPQTDLAHRMLDMVFGIPGMFNSSEDIGTPLHLALQSIFEFYSYGLLAVGLMIILYFTVAVVAETAVHGIPFGKRFKHAWVPIRVVVFFGLIIPVAHGMNGAQFITLYAAKYGSAMATNGWILFNQTIQGSYLGDNSDMIAKPNIPETQHIPAFILLAKTCKYAEGRANESHENVDAFIISGDNATSLQGLSYQDAVQLVNGGEIHFVFGVQDPTNYDSSPGDVGPICGTMVMPVTDISEPGSAVIQEAYFNIIKNLWYQNAYNMDQYALNFTRVYMTIPPSDRNAPLPPRDYKQTLVDGVRQQLDQALDQAIDAQANSGNLGVDPQIIEYGWAGAAIWYNKIAEQNGVLTQAVFSSPRIGQYPRVMEYIRLERERVNRSGSGSQRFSPSTDTGSPIEFSGRDAEIGLVLYQVYHYWYGEDEGMRTDNLSTHTDRTGNYIIDFINALMGTSGLFDMCKNTNVHPLAQMSSAGKALIESSIRNLMGALIGPLGYLGGQEVSGVTMAIAGFLGSIATISLLIGFIMFYVIPFMPFLYFFFSFGGWVKGLFEALVGVGLWALAHLRIDGEGLPGSAAAGGYFLIFEVFIRPILIIFGLLAAIVIFTAMVKVLNDTYYLAVTNMTGHNPENLALCGQGGGSQSSVQPGSEEYFRGPIDELFFTVMYVIIVYMVGMASFKLIDLIPNSILRWMGNNVETFNDIMNDPAEGLMQYIAIGGSTLGGSLQGGLDEALDSFNNNVR